MEKKEYLIMLGDLHGLKIDPDRAERLVKSGGPWDIVQILRTVLFRTDVTGYRPGDDLNFGLQEVKP